jgi:DNA-nicking Smr family endonuclease
VKRRNLTAEELALWRQAMSNTKPLPGRDADESLEDLPLKAPLPSQFREAVRSLPSAPGTSHPPAARAPKPSSGGLDAAAKRRLRRGRIEVEGRVDLHGMRRAEAHSALAHYLAESQAAGRRCILVITGKGGRTTGAGEGDFVTRGDGVLRQQVPQWLRQEPSSSRIFAVEQAHPRHGGAGALYVFLRKFPKDGP